MCVSIAQRQLPEDAAWHPIMNWLALQDVIKLLTTLAELGGTSQGDVFGIFAKGSAQASSLQRPVQLLPIVLFQDSANTLLKIQP